MPVPAIQMYKVASYVLGQKLRGNKRYPLVLMLEPLFRCNLSCAGCGKIQYPTNILKTQLSAEECLKAADECGAPMVAIPGGEPLLHPEIVEIVEGIIAQGRFVYMCTNALILEQNLDRFKPSKYLTFSVHMDGLEKEHDFAVCREGTYEKAYRAIEEALRRGFRVTTNTTLFEGADPKRTREFFDEMMKLGVEGMMVSPGYSYEKAPDQEHFLGREKTKNLFRSLLHKGKRSWRFNQSPLFLEFLSGTREYECTPWGNPTYNVFGWQKPCYLLQEGYADSFGELMQSTAWSEYGHASGNSACQNCMVHSGFEASAVDHAFSSLRGMATMIRATLLGPRTEAPKDTIANEQGGGGDAAPTQGYEAPASGESLNIAFHYRGDVTLTLDDDSQIEGYVSRVDGERVELWRRGSTETQRVAKDRVRHVHLSGRDTAAGKSFEAWVKKQAEKEAAEV